MKERLAAQVDAPCRDEDDAIEVAWDLGMEHPQPGRGFTLERGEPEPVVSILREQPRNHSVAQAAHAVVEHDLRRELSTREFGRATRHALTMPRSNRRRHDDEASYPLRAEAVAPVTHVHRLQTGLGLLDRGEDAEVVAANEDGRGDGDCGGHSPR